MEEYRRRFGYAKNAPLVCDDLRKANSKPIIATNRGLKRKGKPVLGQKSRFRKGHASDAGTEARLAFGTSLQTRQKMSASRQGKALPAKQTVPDWPIASLRLEGKEAAEIARRVSPRLSRSDVTVRLQRIGFPPGKPCRFFRGEPVTAKLLRAHYEDLKFLRMSRELLFRAEPYRRNGQDSLLTVTQVAELLGTSKAKAWLYDQKRHRAENPIPYSKPGRCLEFRLDDVLQWALSPRSGKNKFLSDTKVMKELAARLGVSARRVRELAMHPAGVPSNPRHPDHPLSWDLAGSLLSSMASLRSEYRQVGSTAKGGRPRALLPEEEKGLSYRYCTLKADLELMLTWGERQHETVTMDAVGKWMCEQSRLGRLRCLLFWPNLHEQLPGMCEAVRNRIRGGIGSAERAKELLSSECEISPTQLDRAIFSTVSPALPTPKP